MVLDEEAKKGKARSVGTGDCPDKKKNTRKKKGRALISSTVI